MDNVYTTFYPFYVVLKAFGLFPITFEGPSRKRIFKQRTSDTISSCLVLLSLIFVLLLNLTRKDTLNTSSTILKVSWDIVLLSCVTSHIVSFCYQFLKRESIVEFLKLINEFDTEVKFPEKSTINVHTKFCHTGEAVARFHKL